MGVKDGLSGGVLNFENLTGGSGNDLLIGNAGVNDLTGNGGDDILVGLDGIDLLTGANGRDILIGGNGSDTLDGGADDDVLVANRTTHDTNLTALLALMAELVAHRRRLRHANRSPNRWDDTRSKWHLLSQCRSIIDDGAVDVLTGGGGMDWFVALSTDNVMDLNTGGAETWTNL